MNSAIRPAASLFAASLLMVCLLFAACKRSNKSSPPEITFTTIPPSDIGGPEKLEAIEGRVTHARRDQRIVIYARSEDLWWVQPYTPNPFTEIQGERWKNRIHLGTDYAVLLVDPGYNPPQIAAVLPSRGNGVETVALVKGMGPPPVTPPVKTIDFSGYQWNVRTAPSFRGGSLNHFETENVWTDERGQLHLRIAKRGDGWSCAEVRLIRSLGYGTYAFVVKDVSHLEPSAVLTLFTWDDLGTEQNRRELDVEISRWGYVENENTHYVVQPYYIPTNVVRFNSPPGVVTQMFRWEPAQVTFATYAGSRTAGNGQPTNQHVFTTGIPQANDESTRINLYVFGKGQIPLQHENEVVIERFEYYP